MREYYAIEKNAQKHRDNMTGRMHEHYAIEGNTQQQRNNMKERMQSYRSKEEFSKLSEYNEYEYKEDALLASLKIEESKTQFLSSIQKSARLGKGNNYKATVCVVCDNFIIGKEKVCWTSMRIYAKIEEKLSVERYHIQFDCILPDTVRK